MVDGVSKYVIVGPIVQSNRSVLYLLSLIVSVSIGTDVDCCFNERRGGGCSGRDKVSNHDGLMI